MIGVSKSFVLRMDYNWLFKFRSNINFNKERDELYGIKNSSIAKGCKELYH
jgi:hypothetical protein